MLRKHSLSENKSIWGKMLATQRYLYAVDGLGRRRSCLSPVIANMMTLQDSKHRMYPYATQLHTPELLVTLASHRVLNGCSKHGLERCLGPLNSAAAASFPSLNSTTELCIHGYP